SIEQHSFDANVVMKILDVTRFWNAATDMRMNGRSRVRGKRDVMRICECRRLEKSGYPGAPGSVRLQNVHSARIEHPSKIRHVVPVFPCRDIHPGGRTITDQSKTFEIVGRNRLLEPSDIIRGEHFCKVQRLLPGVCAVRIDEQLRAIVDC